MPVVILLIILISNVLGLYVLHSIGWLAGYLIISCMCLICYVFIRTIVYIYTKLANKPYKNHRFKVNITIVVISLAVLLCALYFYKKYIG